MKEFLQRASSRKFLLALIFAALVVINKKLQLGLTESDLILVGSNFVAFIAGEVILDVQSQSNDIREVELGAEQGNYAVTGLQQQ